jgi:hypothetical protein
LSFGSFGQICVWLLLVTGCGIQDRPLPATSDTHYITFGGSFTGLVAKVKQPAIRVCLRQASGEVRARFSEDIVKSVKQWLEPIRGFTSEPLTDKVEIVDGAARCDAAVEIVPGVHSNAQLGSTPVIKMQPNGYFGSYNVLLHEFGHAFALSDTYAPGGVSGVCRPGQPQAVMCNTAFKALQPDDISGLKVVFSRAFPNDKPGDPRSTTLFVGVSESAADSAALYFARDEQAGEAAYAPGDAIEYCVGKCTTKSTDWKATELVRNGKQSMWRSSQRVELREGLVVSVKLTTQTGPALRYVQFNSAAN